MRDDVEAVVAQLASGQIAEGAATAAFEQGLAARYGFTSATAVGSGCQALLLALRTAGVGKGDGVALPTYVCPEVMGVVEAIGATPVLADVGDDYLLDPADPALDAAGLKAIILPSMLGVRADASRYRFKVPVIADWAQYVPNTPNDSTDRFELVATSFEATKMFAAGEGGAVLTSSPDYARRLGAMKRIDGTELKLNLYPMSALQAALAASQLRRLDDMLARRAEIVQRYNQELSGFGVSSQAQFRFVLRLEHGVSDNLIQAFAAYGVAVRRPVAVMLHHLRPVARQFPNADRLFAETLSLPMHPSLSDEDWGRVIAAARAVLGNF